MIAEIISVGTELLMGQILNTNTRYISRRLADFGINLYYHVTVGDNHDRLYDAIATGLSRSDIIILTGGLGPTEDDLTKETVADQMGLALEVDQDSMDALVARMTSRGYPCTPNNYKQAMFPRTNCIILKNPNGTAPGCIMEKDGKAAIMMPGPPWEMEPMFEAAVVPYLESRSDCRFYSRTLRIYGKGESQVEYAIRDIVDAQTNPTIAPYAKAAETTLRITARCGDEAEGEAMIRPVMASIFERVGEFVYSTHGRELHEVCAELMARAGVRLAIAESCTGGMVASRLVSVPGSSNWLEESAVTYSNAAKMRRLGVQEATLARFGAVSSQVAGEMAAGIRKTSGADIGVATTGYASAAPGLPAEEVGHVFVALAGENSLEVLEYNVKGDRNRVREVATLNALNLLRKYLLNNACNISIDML